MATRERQATSATPGPPPPTRERPDPADAATTAASKPTLADGPYSGISHAAGVEVGSVADIVNLALKGQIDAVRIVREGGRVIGEAVASLVSILNPATIVLSGQLAACDEILLPGIRERIYERALPLATRRLQLRRTRLGELCGVTGLALITADRLLEADSIDLTLANLATPHNTRSRLIEAAS